MVPVAGGDLVAAGLALQELTPFSDNSLSKDMSLGENFMRSALLWLVGVPIPIILLLAMCTHHF